MNVVILGAGESGVGAALLAKQKGYKLFVSDLGPIQPNFKKELDQHQISYEENKHTEERIFKADIIVKSPGIPDHTPLIRAIREKGIPVISEIEFAAKHTNAVIIGITGSNGKTTTTKLTYHILHTAGLDVGIGGNVGHSFARLIASKNRDYYVLELSSFQLDGIIDFRPNIAILLNITPDHLDRYNYQLDNYIASKFRIIQNQREEDLFIYNGKDQNILTFLKSKSLKQKQLKIDEVIMQNDHLMLNATTAFNMKKCSLKGPHNMFNCRCAIQVAQHLKIDPEFIQMALNTFVNAPHRMEIVAEIDGVQYINDSKATNVDAAYYALMAMNRPIIWVVGGQDKGNDYLPLLDLVKEKVKAIICLGIDNQKIRSAFEHLQKPIEETQDITEAIWLSEKYADDGDVVLLSPACASFDLFKNYEQRGDFFRNAVLKLKQG